MEIVIVNRLAEPQIKRVPLNVYLILTAIVGVVTFLFPIRAAADIPLGGTSVHEVLSFDQRPITFYIDYPGNLDAKVPLLVLIDGSGCGGQMRDALETLYRPGPDIPYRFARIRVEKPGVMPHDDGTSCTEDFRRYYTIDNRVTDHMRVLQNLAATADWWDGRIFLWGWSDGGDIAAHLSAYRPDVSRVVLGAVGGGFDFRTLFEDFWACADESMPQAAREECRTSLRAQFTQIEDNPTWRETWGGEDNSWRVWASRLRIKLAEPLSDRQQPFLLVHGSEDYDSVPVASARALVQLLEANENTQFEYWEVACMGHNWGGLPSQQSQTLREAMLTWLFEPEAVNRGVYDLLDLDQSRISTQIGSTPAVESAC